VTEPEATQAAPVQTRPAPQTVNGNVYTNSDQPQIRFDIQLIEDRGGNLSELGQLRKGFLTGDSELLQGTLRILVKNQLVKVLADSTIVARAGRQVHFQVGGEITKADGKQFIGMDVKVTGKLRDEEIQVDFDGSVSEEGGQTLRIDTSLLIGSGKTVILKYPIARYSKTIDYYWVVTPEVVD